MKTSTGHVLGATYYSKYWRMQYTVLVEHPSKMITVLWEDGHQTTHCTRLSGDIQVSA